MELQATLPIPHKHQENPYLPLLARIVRIHRMVPDNYLFQLRFAEASVADAWSHRPGQFVELSVIGTGEMPISISSPPTRRGILELCVRRVGRVTSALYRLPTNAMVGIRGPYGSGFPVEQMEGNDLLIIAVGHMVVSLPYLGYLIFSISTCQRCLALRNEYQRDSISLRTAKISNRVILMSQSVKKDFETFAPQYAGKARVLQGVSQIPESIYKADLKSVIGLYHLPEKFVYMPNQFWKHKNHEMAFRAVKNLKDRGEKVFVVCSGYPGDYRHPGYFAGFLQKISSWGIRDQVALLGMIPRNHIFMLMRQAICVFEPLPV